MSKVKGRVKLVVFGIVAIAAWGLMLSVSNTSSDNKVDASNTESKKYKAVQQTTEQAKPARLQISKIGVDAKVIDVGQEPSGEMQSPKSLHEIGWYKNSPMPGEKGNSVLAGHLGYPPENGVFWQLDKLVKNDIVELVNQKNQKLKFKVLSKKRFSANDRSALKQIYGASQKQNLNLITCDGEWNQATRDYSDRLVVFTTLIN